MNRNKMDAKTTALVNEWKASLTDKEKQLHELAEKMLKKNLKPRDETEIKLDEYDNGSYYADKCHSFRAFMKTKK